MDEDEVEEQHNSCKRDRVVMGLPMAGSRSSFASWLHTLAWPGHRCLSGTSLSAWAVPAAANCTARRGSGTEKARESRYRLGKQKALVNAKAVHCADVADLSCVYTC